MAVTARSVRSRSRQPSGDRLRWHRRHRGADHTGDRRDRRLAAGIGALAVAYKQGRAESDAYAKALILSGNAAGTTIGQLNGLRKRRRRSPDRRQSRRGAHATGGGGVVATTEMAKATAAAVALERAQGGAADATAKKFIDLGRAPLKSLIQINEAENFLTLSVYKAVKALDEQGKTAEAAAVAQTAYADAIAGPRSWSKPRLGTLQKAWRSLGDAAKTAWDHAEHRPRDDGREPARGGQRRTQSPPPRHRP